MNREKPLRGLLDREIDRAQIKATLPDHVDVLEELVNYGTNMVSYTFSASKKRRLDMVLLLVLLKHFVRMLDAYHELFAASCVTAASLQLRSMLEASVFIEYVLQAESETRAKYLFVADLRRRLKWARRSLANSPERDRFLSSLGEHKDDFVPAPDQETLERQIALQEKYLSLPDLADVNAAIQKSENQRNQTWYAPLGCSSFKALCKAVGREADYAVFYSNFSDTMHASEISGQVKIEDHHVFIAPLRFRADIAHVGFAMTLAFRVYERILSSYRPGQLEEFRRRYLQRWKSVYDTPLRVELTAPKR